MSGAPGVARARSVAGVPIERKKSSRLSAGLPEQITSMRAVGVSTRNVWAAPRATNAKVPGAATATSPSSSILAFAWDTARRGMYERSILHKALCQMRMSNVTRTSVPSVMSIQARRNITAVR